MLSFLLVPLYTTEGVLSSVAEYGEVSVIFSYFVLFNVVLAYGMETAFFRFFNKEDDKNSVIGTSAISLIFSSIGFFHHCAIVSRTNSLTNKYSCKIY